MQFWRHVRLLLQVLLLGFGQQLAFAEAQDLVMERAWLEDPTGQLSWEEVRRQSMTPIQGMYSGGFSTAAVWMRLRIDPKPEQVRDAKLLYLRIRPMYLDDIVLYDPLQQPPRQGPIGDHHPVSAQAEPATSFLYALPMGEGPRDIWLRVQTTSTRLIYADVFTPADLRRSDARISHLGTLYLGVIAVFFLWGLAQALIRPEPLMISFVVYQGCSFLVGACFLGYAYLYWPQEWPPATVHLLTVNATVFATAAVMAFSHCLLQELGKPRWRTYTLAGLFGIFPLLLIAIWSGRVMQALEINMWLVLVVPLLLWLLALMSRVDPAQVQPEAESMKLPGLSKPMVVGYFSLVLVFTLLTALPALGIVQGVELSLYVVFFYSLSSGLLMVLMLQYRAWHHQRLQAQWRQIAHTSKVQADQEKAHREEQERLLAMLGHELKTPLATMRMLVADRDVPAALSRQFDQSISEMARVVELAIQSGQVEAGGVPLNPQPCRLRPLIESACDELGGLDRLCWQTTSDGEAEVVTDIQLLKLVIRNLLDNALKYSPARSEVVVALSWSEPGAQWSLRVTNPVGRAGFPHPERVFEKYYRSPQASHRTGTGLGLYLVQGLVRMLGGQLRYEAGQEEVSFILTMPQVVKGNAG